MTTLAFSSQSTWKSFYFRLTAGVERFEELRFIHLSGSQSKFSSVALGAVCNASLPSWPSVKHRQVCVCVSCSSRAEILMKPYTVGI